MSQTAFQRYINNFKGFTREIWILTLITFYRAGNDGFAVFIQISKRRFEVFLCTSQIMVALVLVPCLVRGLAAII
jgi:hypothetical protein